MCYRQCTPNGVEMRDFDYRYAVKVYFLQRRSFQLIKKVFMMSRDSIMHSGGVALFVVKCI